MQELDEAARRRMPKQLYIPLPCAAARRQMVDRLLGELPLPCSRRYLKLHRAVGRDGRRWSDCRVRGPCYVAGDLSMHFQRGVRALQMSDRLLG